MPEGYANLGFISCRAPDRYLETRGDEKQPLVSSRAIRRRFNLEGIQGIPTVSRDTMIFSYLSKFPQTTPESLGASAASLNTAVTIQSLTAGVRDVIDQEPSANPADLTSRSATPVSSDQWTASSHPRPG